MSSSYEVMGDFLQRHAYENVWCTPNQDKQSILQPARLSPDGGAWKDMAVMWRTIPMPERTGRFHVYQIGQIHPLLLGLSDLKNEWLNLAEVCANEDLIVDLYVASGVQLHRTRSWMRVTQDNNLILAVSIPKPELIPVDLNTQALFVRLYTNAYFHSTRSNSMDDLVEVVGQQVTTVQELLDIQSQLAAARARSIGHTYCFVNGFAVDTIDLITARVGDYVEYVYDSSIKKLVTFDVAGLEPFVSTLDALPKYLLHYNQFSPIIDYHDDIDFYLIKPGVGARFKGVYYHKNNEKAVRMVTHQDYAVPVQYLQSYAQQRPELGGSVDGLKLVLHVRHSGYDRPLVREHNRILDLYKLPADKVLAAMVGVDSTVSVWQAAALEASGYTALMRAELGGISRQNVQEAYGYNAVSVLLGDTPRHTRISSGLQVIDVPPGLTELMSAYEYDADGFLVQVSGPHTTGTVYATQNPAARLVETIFGQASLGYEAWWGVMNHPIDETYNHRFYTCGIVGGVIDNQWTEVTDSSQYAVVNGVVQWFVNPATTYTLVKSNKKHVYYTQNFLALDGLYTFTLREWRDDLQAYRPMAVPPGKLDVWVNGKSLIEGLDYIVDFPRVTLTNKEYLVNPDTQAQLIAVRASGFCKSDLSREAPPDVGFIQYGVLSLNNRYDIRDDKVNRIVIDGALYRYDELKYAEDDFEVRVTDVRNGAPYAIDDVVVPMNDYLHGSDEKVDPTYTLRERSQAVDQEVSDYLTLKIPQKDPSSPSAIAGRYTVASPFFTKLIYDLKSGALWREEFVEHYSDNFVRTVCQPYEYLINYDPIKEQNTPDDRFVVIHPHNLTHYVDLGIYQFRFLSRAHALYGRGKLELSPFVRAALFE